MSLLYPSIRSKFGQVKEQLAIFGADVGEEIAGNKLRFRKLK